MEELHAFLDDLPDNHSAMSQALACLSVAHVILEKAICSPAQTNALYKLLSRIVADTIAQGDARVSQLH